MIGTDKIEGTILMPGMIEGTTDGSWVGENARIPLLGNAMLDDNSVSWTEVPSITRIMWSRSRSIMDTKNPGKGEPSGKGIRGQVKI